MSRYRSETEGDITTKFFLHSLRHSPFVFLFCWVLWRVRENGDGRGVGVSEEKKPSKRASNAKENAGKKGGTNDEKKSRSATWKIFVDNFFEFQVLHPFTSGNDGFGERLLFESSCSVFEVWTRGLHGYPSSGNLTGTSEIFPQFFGILRNILYLYSRVRV